MPIRLQCSCGKALTVAASLAGRKIRCSQCNAVLLVPASAAPSADRSEPESRRQRAPAPAKSSRTERRRALDNDDDEDADEQAAAPPASSGAASPPRQIDLRSSMLWSLGWCVVGLNLAWLVPWIALGPAALVIALNALAPLVTMGLIGWNLVESVRLVRKTGQTLSALPLTLAQTALFGLLFFQICCHLGADNYSWDETPRWFDWFAFVGLNALRAADVLDLLEAYGFSTGIQSIQHNSLMTALCLIAFRLVLDLFLISLFMEALRPLKERFQSKDSNPLHRGQRLGCVVMLFFVVWLVSVFFVHPWGWLDMLLWPIDNLLRVLDFMDAMETFHVRLHHVPNAGWDGTLTMACKFLFGAMLVGMLERGSRKLRLRHLGGFGLNAEDLESFNTKREEPELRELAARRLAQLERAQRRRSGSWRKLLELSRTAWLMAAGYAGALLLGMLVFTRWEQPAVSLGEAALGQGATAPQAHAALRRMGSYAEETAPALQAALPEMPRERQLETIATLGALGKRNFSFLKSYLDVPDEDLANAAVRAFEQSGPEAAPTLVHGLKSRHASVRTGIGAAFTTMGPTVVQTLLDQTTKETFTETYEIVERIDPYWPLKRTKNELVKKMLTVRECLNLLEDPADFKRRHGDESLPTLLQSPYRKGMAGLEELGEFAAPAIPFFLQQLDGKQPGWAIVAIANMNETGVPVVLKLLDDPRHRAEALAAASRNWMADNTANEKKRLGPLYVVGLLRKLAAAGATPVRQPDGKIWQEQLSKAIAGMLGTRDAPGMLAQPLVPLLGDPSAELRAWALWTIAQFPTNTTLTIVNYLAPLEQPLRQCLNDPEPAIRTTASQLLDRHFSGWRQRK